MKVRILEVKTGEYANAVINRGWNYALPSLHNEGWKYNFKSQSRRLKNSITYVLVMEETPQIIEGCLIFQMKDGIIPYGACLEVAPHNRGDEKKHDHVAGCLIAFAFQLSLDQGKGHFKGMLYFDVVEEKPEDEAKLKKNYINRYGAEEADGTTMWIREKNGYALIKKYLRSEWDDTTN